MEEDVPMDRVDGDLEDLEDFTSPRIFHLAESAYSSSVFERKVAARKVSDAFRQAYFTEQDVGSVIAVVEKLAEDDEQTVRTEVMEQVPQVAIFCHEVGPQLDYVVPQHILPCIIKLMTDRFAQVRKPTQTGLILLLERGIVARSQVQEHIYPVIMECTAPKSNDDLRTELSSFLSKIAALVGKDITISYYLERFCDLCDDHLFQVRRVCASSMGCLADVIGRPLTEKVLLPRFLALCVDDVWGVRKGCAEVFTEFSSACQVSDRRESLSSKFVLLLEDSSRWVRIAAYQTLGSLISTFSADEPAENPQMSAIEQEFYNTTEFKVSTRTPMKWKSHTAASRQSEINTYKRDQPPSSPLMGIARCTRSEEKPEIGLGSGDFQLEHPVSNNNTDYADEILESITRELDLEIEQEATTKGDIKQEEEVIDAKPSQSDESDIFECDEEENSLLNTSLSEQLEDIKPVSEDEEKVEVPVDNTTISSQESTPQTVPEPAAATNAFAYTKVSVSVSDSQQIHIHLEKENMGHNKSGKRSVSENDSGRDDGSYNAFQYWRIPVPEIDLDIEMLGSRPTNIHVRAMVQDPHENTTYTSEVNLNLTLKGKASVSKALEPIIGDSGQQDNQNLGVKSISTKEPDSAEISISQPAEVLQIDSHSFSTVEHYHPFGKTGKKDESQEPFPSSEVTWETNILESNSSQTTVSIAGGNVSADVHRSYMNLFNPSTSDQGMPDMRPPNPYDDFDYYNDITSIIPPDDLPYILRAHGPKGERGRLLPELPKSVTIHQQEIVPAALLEHFIGMCEPLRDHTLDTELTNFCVYNLPAVVLTLGPQNWSLMRDCFESLACKYQWKIRFTLAASLHDIARVLGPELTERDLIPFYDAMTKDLDEVRIGILRNLAKFVTILGQTERRRCLESLGSFLSTDNKRNWRFRLELCQQVEQLVEIYEAEDVFKHLCPLSVDLITDSVAEIRRSALDLVTILASRLSECHLLGNCSEPNLVREFILELVETLCHSGRWVQRQTYATLSGHLVRRGAITPKQFAQDILPHLVSLSTDKVPNVRLVVAQTLTYVASLDYFLDPSNPHNEIVISTIEKLQDDPDRDVRFFSEMIESE